jgi:hypothetical protein
VRWRLTWDTVKDVALTGTGLSLILSQVFARTPSDVLLVTGLALTVPSVAAHARALLAGRPGPGGGSSSPPSPPPGPPPPGSSPGDAGEPGASFQAA